MGMILLFMTDGRKEYFSKCFVSAMTSFPEVVLKDSLVLVNDDSADIEYSVFLHGLLESVCSDFGYDYTITTPVLKKSGFGGAVENAWSFIRELADPQKYDFVFHLEEDFVFNRPVPVEGMRQVLDIRPSVQQVALRRQPWNNIESAAGGIVESNPDDYTDMFLADDSGLEWLEHRRFFTTNPCLYRRSLCDRGWPVVDFSEGVFSHMLFDEDPFNCSAFFGSRDSGEWVTHIGHERTGHGY
jgi:hypothetical protein